MNLDKVKAITIKNQEKESLIIISISVYLILYFINLTVGISAILLMTISKSFISIIFQKHSFVNIGIISFMTLLNTSSANAVTFTIPPTESFTVTSDFLGTDTISLNVSGTRSFFSDSPRSDLDRAYTVNAAGIVTRQSAINGVPYAIGTSLEEYGSSRPSVGSLTIVGGTSDQRQIFPPNGINGLGSSSPSSNLSIVDVPLASIFGGGIASGTRFTFSTLPSFQFYGESGAFAISGSINSAPTAVPEPFTIIGTLIGGTAAFRIRRKLKAIAS